MPAPSPSPTPILVQLATDNQTPWWWGGALTGAFVVIAAVVAFFSLRASDKRKLEREDRRQWDTLIKDGFVATSTAVRNLLYLKHTHRLLDSDRPGEADDRAWAILEGLRARETEFNLIAPPPTARAMAEVVEAAEVIQRLTHDKLFPTPERQRLIRAEAALLVQVKKSLRITR